MVMAPDLQMYQHQQQVLLITVQHLLALGIEPEGGKLLQLIKEMAGIIYALSTTRVAQLL